MRQLTVEEVSASYTTGKGVEVHVLRDANFTANCGETVAIRGSSGSGKSTLLSLIAGMLRPKTGAVCYETQNIYGLQDRSLSLLRGKTIGFLFQLDFLLPHYSIRENIRMALYYSGWKGDIEARIQQVIAQVSLTHRLEHLPDELSGGERHRAALARAIVHEPELILADEPTGNLDRENATRILALLKAQVSRGSIVLIATHDEWIASQLDREVRIEEGRLV